MGSERKLGIALVGTGFMGDTHTYAYRRIAALRAPPPLLPDLRIVADIDGAAAESFARRWGVPRWTTDWESALEDRHVKLIDICTPPDFHSSIGVAAAEAGLHVYCEKPVGRDVSETGRLAAAVRREGVSGYVGFNYRWVPAVVLAKQLVTEERLGRLAELHIRYQSSRFSDPHYPWSWKFDRSVGGGGALSDQGSHAFDMARFLAGEISSVCGFTDTVIKERPDPENPGSAKAVENEDVWAAQVVFDNGAFGTLHGSRIAAGTLTEFGFDLYGSRGAARWTIRHMNELEVYESDRDGLDGFRTIRIGPEHPFHGRHVPRRGHSISFNDLKAIEIGELLEALAAGRDPRPDMEDALAVAKIVDAIPSRRWVSIKAPEASPE